MCCPIRDEIIVVTSCARSRLDIPDGSKSRSCAKSLWWLLACSHAWTFPMLERPVRDRNHCGDFLRALTLGHSRWLSRSCPQPLRGLLACAHACTFPMLERLVRDRNHCGDFLRPRTLGHSRWLNLAFVTGTIAVTSCLGSRSDIPDG